jgi:hypothetical protein
LSQLVGLNFASVMLKVISSESAQNTVQDLIVLAFFYDIVSVLLDSKNGILFKVARTWTDYPSDKG